MADRRSGCPILNLTFDLIVPFKPPESSCGVACFARPGIAAAFGIRPCRELDNGLTSFKSTHEVPTQELGRSHAEWAFRDRKQFLHQTRRKIRAAEDGNLP